MSGLQPRQTDDRTDHPSEQPRQTAFVVAAALLAAAALSSNAAAQQWLVRPVLEIGVEHIDNPRLNEGDVDTENITGGLLGVGAELRRNTQISSVLFRPAAVIYRYSGDSNEDSESYFMDFEADRQGQRSEWRFAANFSRQEVLRGETTSPDIIDPDVDDPEVDDDVTTTGRTFERRERDLLRIRPGASFDFTERTALKLDFNFIDGSYDSQVEGEAVDFRNSRVDASIVRALTPDSRFEFGVFGSRYEPANTERETQSAGVRARYEKQVSDISAFFVEVGAQESDIPSVAIPGTDVSETSFNWSTGLRRRLERTLWQFSLGQAVTPSGSGFLVQRDLYRVAMRHQLRPRWALDLSAVAMNTEALAEEGTVTSVDRDYVRGEASLGYELTRSWTIEGAYTLTHQDFADTPGDAQEHAVRLSFTYRPPIPTS